MRDTPSGRAATSSSSFSELDGPSVGSRDTELQFAASPSHDDSLNPTPLRVKVTGYRLLNTVVVAGFGIPKAVISYQGGNAIPTTLDWITGVVCGLLLYWLGLYESADPPVFGLRWLFHKDYSFIITEPISLGKDVVANGGRASRRLIEILCRDLWGQPTVSAPQPPLMLHTLRPAELIAPTPLIVTPHTPAPPPSYPPPLDSLPPAPTADMPLDTPTSPAGLHTPPVMPPSASPLSPSGPDTPRLPSHIPLSISPDPPSGPSVTIHGSPRTPPPYYKTVPTLDPPQHYLRPPRPAVPAGPPLRVRGQHDRSAHPDTVLNNYLQATGQSQALRWQTSQLGPANTPMFSVNVILNDELMGTGHGATRAAARNDAARAALVRLGAMAE